MTEFVDLLTGIPPIASLVVGLGFFTAASVWFWRNAVKPIASAVSWLVKEQERREKLNLMADHWETNEQVLEEQADWVVLREIASHFRPNHGNSLMDKVNRAAEERQQAARERAEIQADIGAIKNLLEVHIMERRNGGRRKTDPHE